MRTDSQIRALAAELGRRGGLKGGVTRARTLSPRRRREIAQIAARARWRKASKPKKPEKDFLTTEDLECELDSMLGMRKQLDRDIEALRYVLDSCLKPAD